MTFKFGDVLANGWTSPDNPYHKCIFLRKTKMFIHVRHFDGKLGEFYNDNKHKLTKVGSIINDHEMNQHKEETRRLKREWKLRKQE